MIQDKGVELCRKELCTGCFACEFICPKSAISRIHDEEGFYFPTIDDASCIKCQACLRVCPVLNPVSKNKEGDVFASWINDESIRKTSSSGGMFSAFALKILEYGGVVVGASLQKDDIVRHIIVEKVEDLELLRGSKYVQSCIDSELYNSVKQYLKEQRKVLFCGTPCQVAAIKSVFKNNDNLFSIDLVCHGVPSPLFFQCYLGKLRNKIGNICAYSFRDTNNWLVRPIISFRKNNKIESKPLYGDFTFYQDAFLKGLLHRKSCYNCVYCSKERVGDITLADFWGIGQKVPFEGNTKYGCSMVSQNSQKGKILFSKIEESITAFRRDIQETIDGGNEQLLCPSKLPLGRATFYEDAFQFDVKKLVKKYDLNLKKDPDAFFIRVKRKILKFLNF